VAFLTELVVKDVGDFDWKVMSPLRYEGSSQCFEIPAGAETDFASVPVLFQWLIPRSGRYTKAAVLHDHLWRTPIDGVSKGDADGVFRRCMAELDVPFLRRWVMWSGVRLGSLWKSRFRDRLSDVPQVLLVALFPGLFVIAGGLLVIVFLIGFTILEAVAALALAALRIHPWVRRRTKPINAPKFRLSS
jgi:uncharacterized protein DUF1353